MLHRYWVLWACWKCGLYWQGLIHDNSKLSPSEFVPYAKSFFNSDGSKRDIRDATGAYDPTSVGAQFDLAWLHHQRNKHHWQAWCLIGDGGKLKPIPIPKRYALEMVCDWIGAGIAYSGSKDTLHAKTWFLKNRDTMVLHNWSWETIYESIEMAIACCYQIIVESRF